MSKFKVGDRVRKVGDELLWAFEMGDELTVIGHYFRDALVSNGFNKDIAYDCDLELINPETGTINGVEYIMTENENVA